MGGVGSGIKGHRTVRALASRSRKSKSGRRITKKLGALGRIKARLAKAASRARGKQSISPTGGRSSSTTRPGAVSFRNPHTTGSSARFRNPKR